MIKVTKPLYLQQLSIETGLKNLSIINGVLKYDGTIETAALEKAIKDHVPIFPVIPKRDLKAEVATAATTDAKLNIVLEVLDLL